MRESVSYLYTRRVWKERDYFVVFISYDLFASSGFFFFFLMPQRRGKQRLGPGIFGGSLPKVFISRVPAMLLS